MSQQIDISCGYALGDAICLTGAVRDLHVARSDVRIVVHPPFTELYFNIPYVEISQRPWHGPDIRPIYPLTEHLVAASRSAISRSWPTIEPFDGPNHGHIVPDPGPPPIDQPYWVVVASGVDGTETKWWPHWSELTQALIDSGKRVVAIGLASGYQPELPPTVIDLRGKTPNIRQLASILKQAAGLICPITSAMHLLRAVDPQGDVPMVVLAGGREPPSVFRYPNQTVLYHKPQDLPCAPCWSSRCKLLNPANNATFAPCMSAITIDHVLSAL